MPLDKLCFVEMLRAFVCESDVDFQKNANWAEIVHMGKIHSTSGIIGYVLKQSPKEQLPQNDEVKRLLQSYNTTILHFAGRGISTERLLQKYADAKIPCVPMKGFIVREFYPVKELRTFGDVDLLIRPDDRQKSHAFMLGNGYTCTHPLNMSFLKNDDVWTYKSQSGNEIYEVHTGLISNNFNGNSQYTNYVQTAWEHAVCLPESGQYRFSPEFHFIYVLLHLAKHFAGSGAGVRMFMDIALIVKNHNDIDWEIIKSEIHRLKLDEFLKMVFVLCDYWFDVPPPFEIHGEIDIGLRDELSEYILSGGTFGFLNEDVTTRKLKQVQDSSGEAADWRIKLRSVKRVAFPPVSLMKNQYPVLKKSPVLLPVFWSVRWADLFLNRRKEGSQLLKGLLSKEAISQKPLRMLMAMGLNTHEIKE